MATLYIDRKNSELRHQGKRLLLYVDGQRTDSVPFHVLERVVIHGQTVTNAATLGALAAAGITVVLLTGRFGQQLASLLGSPHNDGRRRLAQYRAVQDPVSQAEVARYLLQRKLLGQQRLLQRARQNRADLRHALHKAIQTLAALRERLGDTTLGVVSLRGLEGAAANAYFAAYRQLFPAALGFAGRRRRPPPDPVNACLSLAYTLAHAEAVRTVYTAGLDPYLGFLHEPDFGRESLAADLIEPLRPRLDAWVWQLFRTHSLQDGHFRRQDDACLLGKTGRGIFYTQYETQAASHRRWMRRQIRLLVQHLTGDPQ